MLLLGQPELKSDHTLLLGNLGSLLAQHSRSRANSSQKPSLTTPVWLSISLGPSAAPAQGTAATPPKKSFHQFFFLMKSEITSAMFGRRLHDTQISSSEAHAMCLQRAGRCTASCGLAARAQGISTGARPHLWPKHPPIGSEHPCVPHDRLQPGNRAPGASLPSISNKL